MFPGFFIGFGIITEENMLYDEIDVSIGANQESDPFGIFEVTFTLKKDSVQITDPAWILFGVRHRGEDKYGVFDRYFDEEGFVSDTFSVKRFTGYAHDTDENDIDAEFNLARVTGGQLVATLMKNYSNEGPYEHTFTILTMLPSGELTESTDTAVVTGTSTPPP